MRAAFALVLAPVGLIAALAWAQSAPRAPRVPFSGGMMTAPGFVTDGGISSASIQSGSATVSGKTSTGSLEVVGSASFGTRPTGVVLSGSLVKAAATGVAVGCSVFGTTTVAGALVGDACVPSAIPTSALTLGITYDCYVTAPATVTLRSCGLVSLVSAPAGTYQVRVIGP